MTRRRRRKKRRKPENISFREFERMMQSANTYEKRGGRIRQKRHVTDD